LQKGGLFVFRHDEIRDELICLAECAVQSAKVRDEPSMHPVAQQQKVKASSAVETISEKQAIVNEDDQGDILLQHGFWKGGVACITDVRATDADAKTSHKRDPAKVLESQEKERKRQCLQPCLDERHHFTLFVCSVDGTLGREASTLAKQLSAKLAAKWQRSCSQICGHVSA
jgi:hypothetical protein